MHAFLAPLLFSLGQIALPSPDLDAVCPLPMPTHEEPYDAAQYFAREVFYGMGRTQMTPEQQMHLPMLFNIYDMSPQELRSSLVVALFAYMKLADATSRHMAACAPAACEAVFDELLNGSR